MWHANQMEPATGRAVIAAGIVGAHDATVAAVGHFGRELRDAIRSCEYHVHPEKLGPIAKALKAWHDHTFSWIAENSKHREVLFAALREAEPMRGKAGRLATSDQIARAVKEWEDRSESEPS